MQEYDKNITYPNDAFSAKCEQIDRLEKQLAIARSVLLRLENYVGHNNDSWVSCRASEAIMKMDAIE